MIKYLEKIDVFWNFDFEGILDRFWEGIGRPKLSIFALFATFFCNHFSSAFRRGEKSAQIGPRRGEGALLELDTGGPRAPGERKREGLQDLC